MSQKSNKTRSNVRNSKLDSQTKKHSQRNTAGNKRSSSGATQGKKKNKSSQPQVAKSKTNNSRTHKTQSQKLFKLLTQVWDCENVRPRNDDFIVESISGVRTNEFSLWPAIEIQRARTSTCIGTKIKAAAPLQTEDEAILEFIKTQEEPVLSERYSELLTNKIDEVFQDFPYEAIKAEVERTDREHIITNGSAVPPLLAPVISGANGNVELIAAMAAGRKIYLSDFHIESWISSDSDGRITTVPKNYKKPRVITITSRDAIDKQYVISDALRDWITSWSRDSNHIIQFDDQSVQWSFLIEGYATLDLSSASDRVYRSLIENVWPEFMTHFGEYLPKTVSTAKGRIIPLTCIGTQGFPLTFTVMAIIAGLITSAVKLSNLPSANYGDDIVVSEKDFSEVYCALEALGFKINKSKTHKSSTGFLESCGKDVMFTKNGPRDVTPIHLRGESDIEIIQFFYQLCTAELMSVENAKSILDKLRVEYYAFEHEYQLTEFHLPFGDPKNVPKPTWSYDRSEYICQVPAIKQEVSSIKGLSKKESEIVLRLLHIEAGMKNPNNLKLYVRGTEPSAKPYAIMDLQDDRLYGLYQKLDVAEFQVPIIFL